ncbi:putative protein FAM90A26 [Eubalaena glacialis]|uniref:putative protein FAM90A26 n=1 Tax=Eubalaena glacialis TaxID=27606 RepID=UPI002A5A532D|nr:putative protein FAM90A26 [Eubalaena glacialis]
MSNINVIKTPNSGSRILRDLICGIIHSLYPLPSTTGLGFTQAHQMTIRTPAPMLSIDSQPLPNSPHLSPIQACTVPQPPPSMHVPDQPLRIVFMMGQGMRGGLQVQNTFHFILLRRTWVILTRVPVRVLQEDLLVSSSEGSDPPRPKAQKTQPPGQHGSEATTGVKERRKEQNFSHELAHPQLWFMYKFQNTK